MCEQMQIMFRVNVQMSSAGCNTECQLLVPFTDCVVNHFLVQMVPFVLDTLVQLFHVRDPVVLVHTLLYDHRIIEQVQIQTVWRPERGRNKNMKRGRDCFLNTNILDLQISQDSVATQLK